jgi:hypothetical protein
LKSHIVGPNILLNCLIQMDIFDESNQSNIEKCQDKAFYQFLVYTYLENSDRTQYGSLLTGLQTQQSLKNNQYPLTLTAANTVLSNHKHNKFNNNNKGKKINIYNNNKKTEVTSKEKEEIPDMSIASIIENCYSCGYPGHRSLACRHRTKISRQQ